MRPRVGAWKTRRRRPPPEGRISTISALRSDIFCTTTPECSSSTSIDDFLDRLEQLARLVALAEQHLRPRHAELEALAAHRSRSGSRAAIRRGPRRRRRRILRALPRPAARHCLRPPCNSRSRMTRLVTLSPSVPASGQSLTRKVIDRSADRSAGPAAARSPRARRSVSATLNLLKPGDGDDVARLASSIGARSMPRKARIFETRPCSTRSPVAVEHLDRLVRS